MHMAILSPARTSAAVRAEERARRLAACSDAAACAWQLSMFSISGSGFAPTVAPAAVRSAAVSPVMAVERSAAIPFLKRPPALDGSMVGDMGFDPLGISTTITELGGDLKYVREAELMHGRQSMLACVGFVFPGACAPLAARRTLAARRPAKRRRRAWLPDAAGLADPTCTPPARSGGRQAADRLERGRQHQPDRGAVRGGCPRTACSPLCTARAVARTARGCTAATLAVRAHAAVIGPPTSLPTSRQPPPRCIRRLSGALQRSRGLSPPPPPASPVAAAAPDPGAAPFLHGHCRGPARPDHLQGRPPCWCALSQT